MEAKENTEEKGESSEEEISETSKEQPSEPITANRLIKPGYNVLDMNMMHKNEAKKVDRSCGYCKGKKENPGSVTWGTGALRLSVDDYQSMMDRGWRRCGTYIYKYDLEQSCC